MGLPGQSPMLLLDFDGTITCHDSEIYVASRVLDEKSRAELSMLVSLYEHLKIGVGEYYRRYFSLMDLDPEQWRQLAVMVPIRAGFGDLLALCQQENIEVMILSEGLDLFIEPLLKKLGFAGLSLSCNRVDWQSGKPLVLPALNAESCERCVNCKGAYARRFLASGRKVALVGNGASDLCAARELDLVFARDHLARLCHSEDIPFVQWESFSDINLKLLRS